MEFKLTQEELQKIANTIADCPRYKQVSDTLQMIKTLVPEVPKQEEPAKPTAQPKKRLNTKDNAKK